ncbi:MAG: SoxR reducing system RseC family protein [Proteobacteria bacterium]|nr:SoxR reducing system RseC family protein [Pseudomonadota bacterium]
MMLETRAVVVRKDNEFTLVEASGASGCSVCEGKGCGSSKVGQMFCSKPRQFKVDNRINAEVGDEVIVSVVEGAVLRGISLVYLLPLALMFAGAAGGWFAGGRQDGYAALGALFGLVAGFACAKWLLSRQPRNQPYITRLIRE